MLWRIILGFIVVGFGFLMVWKTAAFIEITGRIDWAEEKFGGGGTWTFLKLLGVIIIFIGFLIMTNLISGVLQSFAALFTPKS